VIEQLADEWRALCDEGVCGEPFYRPEFIASYVRAFVPDKRLHVVTARVGGRLRAVLPLVAGRGLHGLPVRVWRAAANVHSCRFDVIRGQEDGARAVAAVWQALRETPGWDVIELRDAPQGGACESLVELARRDGHPVGRWELAPSPYLPLNFTGATGAERFQQLMMHLSANSRSLFRRKLERLSKLGAVELVRFERDAPAALAHFYELEAASWKGEQGTAIADDARTRRFYDLLAAEAARRGYFALYELRCGGRTAAMQYCLVDGERCYALKLAHDQTFEAHSPGQLITQEVVREALQRGLVEYDFLGREARWKRSWTQQARPLAAYYVFRRGVMGAVLHAWKFQVLVAARQAKREANGILKRK
jgi:CelD/BcsL family acetyltransferase involved in cellulose biosynthesis